MNPRSYKWLRSILVEGGPSIDVFFVAFLAISKWFCIHNESIELNDVFFHQCAWMLVFIV